MIDITPTIGKNVIETLTSGMYENPYVIYREYVQNSADQIDIAVEEGILKKKRDGQINIAIDEENKTISIKDNATGIKSKEVLQFLGDIANSQKDRTRRKGFRGIGRLGGLGYCETLMFETSYKEEAIKSIIKLDAKQLKLIIEDGANDMDAATVISVITSLEKKDEDKDEHYFKVTLNNVTNTELLNEEEVEKYLSMVAPVPFNQDFSFAKGIYEYFNKNNIKIEEYDVQLSLNSKKLYKAYKNTVHSKTGNKIVDIIDIEFIKILDDENELIALSWYGVTNLLNLIINQEDVERGFRIRKDNIQIGSEDTLNTFFNEDRFNHHFIGEIYVIGDEFIPNARRDNFNDNKTVKTFETKLKIELDNLNKLSHFSSNVHSGIKKINQYKEKVAAYEKTNFSSEYEDRQAISDIKVLKVDAKAALVKINNSLSRSLANEYIKNAVVTVFKNKTSKIDLSVENDKIFDVQKYENPDLSKLTNAEKRIVFDIFKIIEENISDSKLVVRLKDKITKFYN